jgi:hypothetical protein
MHNIIKNNSTYASSACMLAGRLINNTLVGNEGEVGSNVYVGSDPEMGYYLVYSNIISHAVGGEAIYRESVYEQDRIAFNNIWGSAGGGDTLWASDRNSDGNISQDPMFVDLSTVDFRLQMDSPCIDASDPNSDWTAEPAPHGQRINMGAFGGTQQASKSF